VGNWQYLAHPSCDQQFFHFWVFLFSEKKKLLKIQIYAFFKFASTPPQLGPDPRSNELSFSHEIVRKLVIAGKN
jgi:hypothetical protein